MLFSSIMSPLVELTRAYYAIFEKAGISWKKTQKHNPKGDLTIIQKKDEITEWLAKHQDEIITDLIDRIHLFHQSHSQLAFYY